VIADMAGAAAALGHELHAIAVEHARSEPARCARIDRLYILPFDPPRDADVAPALFVRRLFHRADILNSMEVHEITADKIRTEQHLLARGVPVPESLLSDSAEQVRDFVAAHEYAILKDARSCGGQGHVILCHSADAPGQKRRHQHGVIEYPPPFFVQRLVGDVGARRAFRPGRFLRAYVVDGRVAFWTERYRPAYRRPSDWIVNVHLGAKYRFVLETSAELRKLAMRAADALGIRVGAVDIVQSSAGAFVLEADTDGRHMYIDREFKRIPEYRGAFDLDGMIVATLAHEEMRPLAGPL
jgi:glutathione synthase/RimK-type ligase-like ATP-grasp enzyme